MSEREATPPLSIGVMVGGTGQDARRWGDEAMELARRVKALRAGVDSPLNVNVVYQVRGDVVPVDFSGVRTGRYSAADRLLLVQAAVPDGPPVHPAETLIDLLDSAIEEAERFAQRKAISYEPFQALRAVAAGLRAR